MCKYVVPASINALLLMPCGYQDWLMGEYKIKYAIIQIINTFVIDSSRGSMWSSMSISRIMMDQSTIKRWQSKSVFLFDKNDGRSACQWCFSWTGILNASVQLQQGNNFGGLKCFT